MNFGSAVILAGGRGSRFNGADKGLLAFEGRPLAARMAALLEPDFAEILVSTNRPERYADLGLVCVADRYPGRGPLAGIHAALLAASSDWVFAIAGDMIDYSSAYARHMMASLQAAHVARSDDGEARPLACVTRSGRHLEPFHGLYSRGLLPLLESLLGASPAQARGPSFADLLSLAPTLVIEEEAARAFTPDWRLFESLNLPEDLARRAAATPER